MHGHGYAPPQPSRPSTALLVVVRVVLVALALLSFGLLAWGTMLRIAIMRGRRTDWVLFWISLVAAVTSLVVMGEFGTEATTDSAQQDPRPVDWVCLAALFTLAIGVPVHYLVTDIRHHQQPRTAPIGHHPAPGSPYGPYTPPPAYGYPPPIPAGPAHHPAPAHHPTPPPVPPRIDQVRAELDELSDLLRGTDHRDTGPGDRGGAR